MINFLKITKNKIKIFILFCLSYFLFFLLFNFLIGVAARVFGLGFYSDVRIFFELAKIFIYVCVFFVMFFYFRKKISAGKFLKKLAPAFIILFMVIDFFPRILSKIISAETYLAIAESIQFIFFIITLFLIYAVICYADNISEK